MGTCLMCHRKIRDGRKFCDNCKQKRKNKADESYLDSLLYSVGVNQKKPRTAEPENVNVYEFEQEDDRGYVPGNDQRYGQGSDQGYVPGNDQGYVPGNDQGYGQGSDQGYVPGNDQGYGQENYPGYEQENVSGYEQGNDNTSGYYDQDPNSGLSENIDVSEDNVGSQNSEMDDMLSDLLGEMDDSGILNEQQPESDVREEDIESIFDEAEAYAELLSNGNTGQQADAGTGMTDTAENGEYQDVSGQQEAVPDQDNSDFIDLEWNNDGQNAEGGDIETGEPDNTGINSEEDNQDEILLNEVIQGENSDFDHAKEAFSDFDPLEEEISSEEKPKKKRLSWFKRLFGNINDDVTPEMIEAERIKKAEEEEKEKQKKAEKKKKDEEKKALAQAEKERKKAEADAERNRKIALAIEKKNAAKEKQRKKKEEALAIAEYEIEHGKINKAGATILFVIFAVLTIVIIIGTNIYSYNLSLDNAREDFSKRKYNEAYYDVYGYDIKIQDSGIEEDIMLYDKIMTVMYVNSQLNSYEYYMTSDNKSKALDSLLKGLQKYDKYLKLAKELGITSDLDYVKSEILEKLSSEFDLSESEAEIMVANLDPIDYSEYLYRLIGDYEEELKKYR